MTASTATCTGKMESAHAVQAPPARPGDSSGEIDTPALLLQQAPFERNLRSMAAQAAAAGKRLRPHAKAHKCVEIARRQMQAGATGICCQKVSEAEVFVQAGMDDVLVSNEVLGDRKLDRLARLARQARMAVCIDHPLQVAALAQALDRHGATLDVLIEVDVGQGRCGVADPAAAVALAALIDGQPMLRLRGLQAYHGAAQHLRDPQERGRAIALAATRAADVNAALRVAGHACSVVTGAGTGSFVHELAAEVYTEIQPGSYVLMDADYAVNRLGDGEAAFEQALYVLATVITVHGARAVLDAGLKASSAECGPPRSGEPGWEVVSISDEHTVLHRAATVGAMPAQVRALQPGDRVLLIPSHCDPTVNLHDWLLLMQGDEVAATWPVSARGAVF